MPRRRPQTWVDDVLPIFDQPEPVQPRPRTKKQVAEKAAVSWRRHKGAATVLCGRCVEHQRAGRASAIRQASWMRMVGDVTAYLCYRHAAEVRHEDELRG